jgi:hypothetical protein
MDEATINEIKLLFKDFSGSSIGETQKLSPGRFRVPQAHYQQE